MPNRVHGARSNFLGGRQIAREPKNRTPKEAQDTYGKTLESAEDEYAGDAADLAREIAKKQR
jgi:hypothetical protein